MPPLLKFSPRIHRRKLGPVPRDEMMKNPKRLLVPSPATAPSPKRTSSGKKVGFNPILTIEDTIHIADYTPEERDATWYSTDEVKSFKAERKETAKRIDEGDASEVECCRGAESLTIEGCQIRQESILIGINSVLDEQEMQDLDGTENPEMLAHIYRLNTQKSETLAHERGLEDEREVLSR